MAYFKINEPNKEPKWIKSVDTANGTLEFQNSRNNAWYKDSGFFADSEAQFLKFHFKEQYPELEFMTIDDEYIHGGMLQGAPVNQVAEAILENVGDDVAEEVDVAEPIGVGVAANNNWVIAEDDDAPNMPW